MLVNIINADDVLFFSKFFSTLFSTFFVFGSLVVEELRQIQGLIKCKYKDEPLLIKKKSEQSTIQVASP